MLFILLNSGSDFWYNKLMEKELEDDILNYNIDEWKHVFKLDPARESSDEKLEQICHSDTDAIIVGGTDGVTFDAVLELLSRVRRYAIPCVLEISELEA